MKHLSYIFIIGISALCYGCSKPFEENYFVECPSIQTEKHIIDAGGGFLADDVIIYKKEVRKGIEYLYEVNRKTHKSINYGYVVDIEKHSEPYYEKLLEIVDTSIISSQDSFLQFSYINMEGCKFVCSQNAKIGILTCWYVKD